MTDADDDTPTVQIALRVTVAERDRMDLERKQENRSRAQQARTMIQKYWRMVDEPEAAHA